MRAHARLRAGGVRALNHGLSAMILRDVGGFGMYFYDVRPSSPSAAPCLNFLAHNAQYEATLRLPRAPVAHDPLRARWKRRSRSRTAPGRRGVPRVGRDVPV